MSQLALPIGLADHAVFDSFLADGNEALLAMLRAQAAGGGGPGCWIWGAPATGKSHLLQASCAAAGDDAVYLPLAQLSAENPALLAGLENRALVGIDDIDRVAGDPDWEAALFALCNQALDAGTALIVSAPMTARASAIRLPDLRSRLSRLPAYRLVPLGDEARAAALKLRAGHRGLDLPDETARFLLNRSRRDMGSLYRLLDRLDAEALRAQRRLTVPFVRDVLAALKDDT